MPQQPEQNQDSNKSASSVMINDQGQVPFVHLHLHSSYSLAEGAIHPKDLIKLCATQNMPAVAITDSNNMFGALEFALEAQKKGVQPILGAQLRLGYDDQQLVFLAQNEAGYRNLCRLISEAYLDTEDQHDPHVSWTQLEKYHEGLIVLSGGLKGPISQYLLHNQQKDAEKALKKLLKIYGDRFYIELQRHGWEEEKRIEPALLQLALEHNVPIVATNDSYFAKKKMHAAHDALMCIAEGRYISEDDRRKVTPEHYFKSSEEMKALFSDLPEAIYNTSVIAKRCSYLLRVIDPILPPYDTSGNRDEAEELAAQAKAGLEERLELFVYEEGDTDEERAEKAKPYFERLDFELNTIKGMGFPGYFLIVADFIQWAKDHDIPVGPGRGSGAGSVVAWAMKITDLDPLAFNLLFERFLNPERVSMPDFDVDFCQDRRDAVIKYVQDKYGHDHVAQIITFGKLQARAVVRDVGRVLQMPYGQVDRLAKMIPANPANPVTLQEALDGDADLRMEVAKDETSSDLIAKALQLEGLYRHASTHAAGVVIGDRPLSELLPLYRDPRSDMPVTQFNMKYVEQAGLVKFDFLGLKTLTVIQRAVAFIKKEHDVDIDPLTIPFEDKRTFDLLSAGKTTGVFQLESAGMKDVLRKMKPDRFEEIIALVALYRPGPMDNIDGYIQVKNGAVEPDYMHPKLQQILEETFGYMIYQEQVMQAAQILAGYTLGGADLLRRAMGKKIKEEMDSQREMFVSGAKEHNNIDAEQANHIFDQIAKFAGYGFNKSHAAAYALIAYQTAWLKANYPVEFMAASMALDVGNTEKLAIFKQECDNLKLTIIPPDVNRSFANFEVKNQEILYALGALKGVGLAAMEKVVQEREANGPFKDLYDFAERVDVKAMNKKQFHMLACAGGFDELKVKRWNVVETSEKLLLYMNTLNAEKDSGQVNLFAGTDEANDINRPPLIEGEAWDHIETLKHEFDAIGFYLSAHPLDNLVEKLKKQKTVFFTDLEERLASTLAARIGVAGVLIKKQERISAKSGNKFAFLTLSDPTGVFEIMVFADTLAQARDLLKVGESLYVTVDAELSEQGQPSMRANSIARLSEVIDTKRRSCSIKLDPNHEPQVIRTIHDILAEGQRGHVRVDLMMPLTNISCKAHFKIPGGWAITSETIKMLNDLEGVREVIDL